MSSFQPAPLNLPAWRALLRVADATEYAAACRWAVPALLDELEQTRAEVERLCKVVDRAERNNCGCLGYPIDHLDARTDSEETR